MKKQVITIQLLFLLLIISFSVRSQHGTLKGQITDAETGEPLIYANIVLEQNGIQKLGCASDMDGYYILKPIPPGEYDLRIMYIGYQEYCLTGLNINDDKITYRNIALKKAELNINECFVIVNETMPLIQQDVGSGYIIGGIPGEYGNINGGVIQVEPTNEDYDRIVENTFQNPILSPFSTFSVDVDRAAYANVRRFINQDMLPPVDAVRIEELVNYFHYDYKQPKEGEAFSINLEAGDCPWNKNTKIAKVGIQGKNLQTEEVPKGNFVFLIDVSGSMGSHNKLPLVKKSLNILVNNLRDEDKVTIVVYAGAAGCVLKPTSGKRKDEILGAINKLESGGSTAGGEGIRLAYKMARQNFIKNGNNRVILMTDGDFNVGISNDDELVELIEKERESGVFLTVLGYGMGNYKDAKMEKLSNAGNGNYGYIDNLMEAKKMFGTELWGTLYTIAKDVKIQLEFNPALVSSYRLIGYENRLLDTEDFNNDSIDAGEIGAGHTVTAFYEIILKDGQEEFDDSLSFQKIILTDYENLLKVRVRYKNPDEDNSHLVEALLPKTALNQDNSDDFVFATAVVEYGLLVKQSDYKQDASFSSLIKRAKKGFGEDAYGYRHSFVEMAKKTELLTNLNAEASEK